VKGLVIDVGADSIDEAAFKVAGLAEVLLLVKNVVLRASNDTSILDTANSVGNGDSGEVGVGRETFPVALLGVRR
jgi:hypothetical protein